MALTPPAVGDQATAAWADTVSNWSAAGSTYVPVITGSVTNPTLGAGSSISGKYSVIGNMLMLDVQVLFGTSGTVAGSGFYTITLPTSVVVGISGVLGDGYVKCAGVTTFVKVVWASATTVNLYYNTAAVGGTLTLVGAAAPGAWTANDLMRFRVAAFVA